MYRRYAKIFGFVDSFFHSLLYDLSFNQWSIFNLENFVSISEFIPFSAQPAPPYSSQGYPGAPPPVVQPANPQVVVVQTQIPQHRISFGSNPTQMTCNNCKKQVN